MAAEHTAVVRLVEDEADLRMLARTIFEQLGVPVLDEVPPQELLNRRYWSGMGVTHAVVDLRLMGWPYDGLTVLRWLVEHEPKVVRIVCSATVTERYDAIALEVEGLSHVTIGKPYSPGAFDRIVR